MRSKLPTSLLAAAGLGAAGVGLCVLLVRAHADPLTAQGLCGPDGGCGRVLASRYATLAGVPLPWLGLVYYTGILAASVLCLALPAGPTRHRVRGLAILATAGAALASAALVFIQLFVLRAFCPLCACSAATVSAICVTIFTGWRADRDAPAWEPRPVLAAVIALALLVAAVPVLALGVAAGARSRPAAPVAADGVVAVIDGEALVEDQMRRDIGPTLSDLEHQAYRAKRAWIDQKTAAVMLSAEARRRGTSVDELIDSEVEAKVRAAREAVDRYLAREPAPAHPGEDPAAEVRRRVIAEAREENSRALIESLRTRHHVRVLLVPPADDAPHLDLSLANVDGPADAPVKLVVFSDYECPFCAEVAGTLRDVRRRFGQAVMVAYRPFPLESHPRGREAAEAAACAAEQGRFAEFHDRLERLGGHLGDVRFDAVARDLGLDMDRFEAVRRSGAAARAVDASRRDAEESGIDSVPAVYLNGRRIGGRVAPEELNRLVLAALPPGHRATTPIGRAN